MSYTDEIKELVKGYFHELSKASGKQENPKSAMDSTDTAKLKIVIEKPQKKAFGDFALPCFGFAKALKKSPALIAKEIAEGLGKKLEKTSFEKTQANGSYVNFFLKKESYARKLLAGFSCEYGKDSGKDKEQDKEQEDKPFLQAEKKVMIEYLSPNTNKPLHLGHLRNIFIGKCLSNLARWHNNKVIEANLMNDRGIHICKSMLAYKKLSQKKEPDKKPDHFIGDLYVLYSEKEKEMPKLKEELKEMLKKWESGDKETIELWKKLNSWAYEGFNETLRRLKISFDKIYYESEIYKSGKEIIEQGLRKGALEKTEDNAVIAKLDSYGLPDKVVLRSDGTSIYITQDIFLAIKKFKDFNLDYSYYVVASEQNLHFKQLFAILKLLGYAKVGEKSSHISYGLVNLPSGRMKSREGTVVDADNILDEMQELAKEEIKKRENTIKEYSMLSNEQLAERAELIGQAALRFFILKIDPQKDMVYYPEKSISFEGETGPYLLYSYARMNSIIKKAGISDNSINALQKKAGFSYNEKELELVSFLEGYKPMLSSAWKSKKPSIICRYLMDICQLFNEYYHSTKVLVDEEGKRAGRLLLVIRLRQMLKHGLGILSISVPDVM